MFDLIQFTKNYFKMSPPANVDRWKCVFDEMAVHTRKRFPEELLMKQRPNETKEVFDYRKANYEPITYGSMNRALDSLYRIVSGVNYAIVADDDTKEYLRKRVFFDDVGNAYTFDMYMQRVVLKRGIEDPNGYLVWLPGGAGLADDAQRIEAKPMMVYSSEITHLSHELFSYKACNEYSEVVVNKQRVMEGEVYHVHTPTTFYRLEQFGAKDLRKFRLVEVYAHNLGEIPAIVFGGDMNSLGYFESFFAPYNAFGNQAIRQFTDWQAIMVTSGYPYTEEFYAECSIQAPDRSVGSADSSLPDPNEEEFSAQNNPQAFTPKTQLQRIPRDPYNVIIRRIPSSDGNANLGENVLPADIPSKRFIYPDVSIAKYSGESWEKMIAMAEAALHLSADEKSNVSEETTRMQKEERYAMIEKIGNNFFDNLMLNSLRYIAAYGNRTSAENSGVSINRTATFKIKTEEDLVNEIGTLKQQSAPSLFISAAVQELSTKRFHGNPLARRTFEIIPLVDPLWAMSSGEKQSMVMAGGATTTQLAISTHAYTVFYRIAKEMTPDGFIKADDAVLIAKFNEAVKPLLPPELTPIVEEDGEPV